MISVGGSRILVTGSGGVAGVNFVRALRSSDQKYYVVGTDHNRFHIEYPDVVARYFTPRHDDRNFVPKIAEIVRRESIDFVHPQPSSEALVISARRRRLGAAVFLPSANLMRNAQDKLVSQRLLKKARVPVPATKTIRRLEDVKIAFSKLGRPLWARARHGAGGRLSLLCNVPEEAQHWVRLWSLRGVDLGEMILQEYLPGRNVAWDSIWKEGRLITSYARERLEYPFKHISPSGITGTPSAARIIHDDEVNEVARKAVLALGERPDGAFSVDLKGSSSGVSCVTEVDAGKFHTTMPLWGYAGVKLLGMPWYANLADLYVRIGLGQEVPSSIPQSNLFPAGYHLLRDMDVGAFLWREDGWKRRLL
jgi:carbamoyl-phosphate synthase large subunit